MTTAAPSLVSSFAAGDFNGDGKADVVMLSTATNDLGQATFPYTTTLTVLIGKGDGSFQPSITVATFPSTGGNLNVGDFNGDGKLDLAVVYGDGQQGSLGIFLGKGDGTFVAPPRQNTAPLDSTRTVFVADLNRDGKPDLIVGGPRSVVGGAEVVNGTVLLGNGDGTFQSPMGFTGEAALVADLNRDGIPDVVTTDLSGVFNVLLGRGDGTFRTGAAVGVTYAFPYVVSGDFNGDGKTDLAISGGLGGVRPGEPNAIDIILVLGNGDGTFQAPANIPGLGGSVLAADLNQDGKLDLVSDYSVILGNGDGTFGPPYYLSTPNYQCDFASAIGDILPKDCGGYSLSSVAADINGDGLPDLFTVGPQAPSEHNYSTFSLLSSFINDSPGDGFLSPGVPATGGAGFFFTLPGGPPGSAIGQNSLVTAYGVNLAQTTATASGPPFPTVLGGISLHVGTTLAPLLYVSPTQINYLAPPGPFLTQYAAIFANPAIYIERIGTPAVQKGLVLPMFPDAPGLFSVDSGGVAAATAVRVAPDGTQTPVPVFNCSTTPCAAVPIDLSGDPVYLSFYGTGFDYNASAAFLQTVTCQAGSTSIGTTVYAGPQGIIPGMNQINVMLAKIASGTKSVSCQMVLKQQFPSQYYTYSINVGSNPVQIAIK